MPGLHSHRSHGARNHHHGDIDRDTIAGATKAVLDQATTGDVWVDPRGQRHIPILVGGAMVGSLWEDADLATLEAAGSWAAPFGAKVELAHDGKVVGMLRVNL